VEVLSVEVWADFTSLRQCILYC